MRGGVLRLRPQASRVKVFVKSPLRQMFGGRLSSPNLPLPIIVLILRLLLPRFGDVSRSVTRFVKVSKLKVLLKGSITNNNRDKMSTPLFHVFRIY